VRIVTSIPAVIEFNVLHGRFSFRTKYKGPALCVKKDGQNIVSNARIAKALRLTPFFFFFFFFFFFVLGTSCVKK
jgi:hypothetical protein